MGQDGSKDLFVHRSQLADGGSLVVGAEVSYAPGWDSRSNKPQAEKVQGAIPQISQAPARSSGALTNGPTQWQSKGGQGPPATIGTRVTGMITAWREDRGMGFIRPNNG